jgi:metal-responsive CopG/Arc/MetJ family transcriptional regulator
MKSTAKTSSNLFRLQVELPAARVEQIDEIVELTGMKTRGRFVEDAINLFARCVSEAARGNMLAFVTPGSDSYREVVMPSLDHIRDESFRTQSPAPQKGADRN